jgi:ribokinase
VTGRVVVYGDALLDVHAVPSLPPRRGADVPADIRSGPGGQGANIAVRLARRGIATRLVCGLGDDPAGALLQHVLADEGIDVSVIRTPATGTVVILGDAEGERTMLSDRASFVAAAVDAAPGDASWSIVSGYLLLEEAAMPLVEMLAAAPGRRALAGCALPDDSVASWRERAARLRPDLLVLNAEERDRLGPVDGAQAVAITEADGAEMVAGDIEVSAAVAPGPPAVDTTGAGDAFAAILVAALLDTSWPPPRDRMSAALEAAVDTAAAVARTRGAQARTASERRGSLIR